MTCYFLQGAAALAVLVAFCGSAGLITGLIWLIGKGLMVSKWPEWLKNRIGVVLAVLIFTAFGVALGFAFWSMGGEVVQHMFHYCVGG